MQQAPGGWFTVYWPDNEVLRSHFIRVLYTTHVRMTSKTRLKTFSDNHSKHLVRIRTQPICTKICTGVVAPNVIMCAKFHSEIIKGYDFTRGRNFDFPNDFCMGLTTSSTTALRVMLCALEVLHDMLLTYLHGYTSSHFTDHLYSRLRHTTGRSRIARNH